MKLRKRRRFNGWETDGKMAFVRQSYSTKARREIVTFVCWNPLESTSLVTSQFPYHHPSWIFLLFYWTDLSAGMGPRITQISDILLSKQMAESICLFSFAFCLLVSSVSFDLQSLWSSASGRHGFPSYFETLLPSVATLPFPSSAGQLPLSTRPHALIVLSRHSLLCCFSA